MSKNWPYSHIPHGPRKSLGLTLNEYAVLDMIYKDQVYPAHRGVSRVSINEIALALDLSKGGVFGIIERSVEKKYLEIMSDGARCTTAAFYEVAYTETETGKPSRSENERGRSESERNRSESERYNNSNNSIKNNKAKRSPRSATVEDKLSKVEGLKDEIGETQYNILNGILSDEAYYSKLRKLYAEDKFKFLRDWLRYRKERKNSYRIAAPIRLVINSLLENTNEDCAAALRSSVMNQYQGLFVKPSFANPSRPGYQQ